MSELKSFLREVYNTTNDLLVILAFLFCAVAFLVLLEKASPVITVLFVAVFTAYAFKRWVTGLLAVGGIVLYIASWPIYSKWGIWPGQITCLIGIAIWFVAVFIRFGAYLISSPTQPCQ